MFQLRLNINADRIKNEWHVIKINCSKKSIDVDIFVVGLIIYMFQCPRHTKINVTPHIQRGGGGGRGVNTKIRKTNILIIYGGHNKSDHSLGTKVLDKTHIITDDMHVQYEEIRTTRFSYIINHIIKKILSMKQKFGSLNWDGGVSLSVMLYVDSRDTTV